MAFTKKQEKEGTMISDWLNEHGNPEIEKKVEREAILKYGEPKQETHLFSEEDMIEFVKWVAINYVPTTASKELKYWQKDTYQNKEYFYSTKELLQLWKEQQPKTVYYE